MAKLLLEVLTEEVPAGYLPNAASALEEIAGKRLDEAGLPHGAIASYGTPRRIVLTIDGLPRKQEDRTKKISGPPKKAGVAADGSFTNVAEGFAKKYGRSAKDLQVETTPKGEYLYLSIEEKGRETAKIFEELLPQTILSLPFPKTMRWGNRDIRFARPIRSVVALLDKKPLKFSLDGIKAGNKTMGHRFTSAKAVVIKSPESYESALNKAGVIAHPEKRKKAILDQFAALEKKNGLRVIRDEDLIEEVCYLTENPVAVLGSFKESYLVLPRELLVTVMEHHQRYFPAEDAKGNLANRFVAFSNIKCKGMTAVRRGYERVLEARLSDARFFFDEDKKHPLQHFNDKLSGITYMKGLGTVADKVERIKNIAGEMVAGKNADTRREVNEVATLCKFDLATQMVFEFPELQGIMGREYAKTHGLDARLAEAIDQHYRPRFSGDELPGTDVATIVALADKMDSICGCFALGLIPTGSEDPFSLRRHALGIVRILLAEKHILLGQLISLGCGHLPETLKSNRDKLRGEVKQFLAGRVKNEFTNRGISYDVVDAVLETGFDSLPDALARCLALAEMKKQTYAENLSITFRRAANIVKGQLEYDLREDLLGENVEKELYNVWQEVSQKVAPLKDGKEFLPALQGIADIRPAVDALFDGVMVMDKEHPELMNNRVALLRKVTGLFEDLADFSKLVFNK
ncbi:MAG: glycine--tRNA ligase subunit beta [Nitrospinae bacterium]|nr:glycine--tRNA ligase subunit beta [Nitrospinota bacterium]